MPWWKKESNEENNHCAPPKNLYHFLWYPWKQLLHQSRRQLRHKSCYAVQTILFESECFTPASKDCTCILSHSKIICYFATQSCDTECFGSTYLTYFSKLFSHKIWRISRVPETIRFFVALTFIIQRTTSSSSSEAVVFWVCSTIMHSFASE